mmetsp:Transcript_108987/g.260016  ORF Transcript_108987/g.260016 Transcript_108987/m.260016 type:complete len:260 (+) Transcript_108987:1-780(+)
MHGPRPPRLQQPHVQTRRVHEPPAVVDHQLSLVPQRVQGDPHALELQLNHLGGRTGDHRLQGQRPRAGVALLVPHGQGDGEVLGQKLEGREHVLRRNAKLQPRVRGSGHDCLDAVPLHFSPLGIQHHQKRVQAPTRPAATLPAIAKPPEIALLIQSERHYLSLAVVGNQDLSTEAVVHHQLDVASFHRQPLLLFAHQSLSHSRVELAQHVAGAGVDHRKGCLHLHVTPSANLRISRAASASLGKVKPILWQDFLHVVRR